MIHSFDNFLLDTDRRELWCGLELVAVEPQVFDLLQYLIAHRDRVVSKDDLLSNIWGGRIVSDSAITSRITAVRHAIGDSGRAQRLIRTIPRRGFRFAGEVRENQQNPDEAKTAVPIRELSEQSATSSTAMPNHQNSGASEVHCRPVDIGTISPAAVASNAASSPRNTETVSRPIALRLLYMPLTRTEALLASVLLGIALFTLAAWTMPAQRRPSVAVLPIRPDVRKEGAGRSSALHLPTSSNAEVAAMVDSASLDLPSNVPLGQKGRLERAEKLLRRALEKDSDSAGTLYHLGLVCKMRAQYGVALQSLSRALELNPSLVQAHAQLGHTLVRLGRPKEGMDQIRYAIRRSPDEPSIGFWYLFAGEAALELGDSEEALRWMLRAHDELHGRHQFVHGWLAATYALSGSSALASKLAAELKAKVPAEQIASMLQQLKIGVAPGQRRRLEEGLELALSLPQ